MDYKVLLIIAIIAIFGGDIIYTICSKKKKNELLEELNILLSKEDYDAFDKLIDTDQVKKSFSTYNIAYMKLNEAMMKNSPSEINKAFTGFNIKMSPAQREAILKRAFYYYIGIEDKKRTEHYYKLLLEMKVKDQLTLDIMYDTYINKGYRYLDEVLNNFEKLSKEEQAPYIAILAEMYRNKGDLDTAKQYDDRANKIIQNIEKYVETKE